MREVLSHQAVLVQETIAALKLRPDGVYVDGTFGRGGHARAILEALGPKGRLLALDRDPAAEQYARECFGADARFSFERTALSRLAESIDRHGLRGRIQGIVLDLGVSSPQLDDSKRGFSFLREGPLDMRMDPTTGRSAAEWLATADAGEIAQVLRDFGEERYHRRIANAIVKTRRTAPLSTTSQLARLIAAAVPTHESGKHPATRSFQAIRIFINQELTELQAVLPQALKVLAPDGRLVVISFHSLEDRLVKRFMQTQARGTEWPLDLPVITAAESATLRVIGRALRPTQAETRGNPRARSAILRVAERLA
ncbi:MAG TPA: 16S rRNA (cytosine(1402)-N(4))-methyltransferase RsmH [Candidatus Competibacteraceae bacterium]|nr:16S rRNA (cytosine(1402)-N(4))-methyltransferase RsmH [Candidatus Competibacteraceae bacterium]